MKKVLCLAFLAFSLLGCAASPQLAAVKTEAATVKEVVTGGVSKVQEITLDDLQTASTSAHEHNDVLAYTCYDYVITILPAIQANPDTVVPKGAVSAFQNARNLVKGGQKGFSDDFKLACAPLYVDAKNDVIGLVGTIAGLAAKIGVKLPIL